MNVLPGKRVQRHLITLDQIHPVPGQWRFLTEGDSSAIA
jgi:hypothetical protein